MIEFSHFSYTFPGRDAPALHDLSLRIAEGAFVLVTGTSGAGKSTLLRALSGLVPHFSGGRVSGQIRVNGHDPLVEGPRALSRVAGTVFQNPEAQAVLERVEAEIAFGLENAAVPLAEMRERVEEVLALLDLRALRDRRLSTLSGGERQRVAIATALALRPQVLVLDEPTSQLDPEAAADLLEALARLNRQLDLTVVLAEHRLERVLPYANRVVALADGELVAEGPVPEVLDRIPQLPPVATLGRSLGWETLPQTLAQARRLLARDGHSNVPGPNGSAGRRPNGSGAGNGHSPAPLLHVHDLDFAYGQTPILRGVSFEVHPGEVVALMGANGSGKTTLLKTIVGLLPAGRGEVWLNGRLTAGRDVAEIAQEVAYLPQTPDDLLFADTVREELAITLRNHGRSPDAAQIDPLLARLGLSTLAGHYPRDLSVGQRQRVALGAVMVTHPSLLLLDEPTRGLDYAAKQELVALWRQWRAEGMGLLLVTHDVELVARVADRVLFLEEGSLVQEGPAAAVFDALPRFAPQVARLFPGRGWLTVEDALAGLNVPG